jgi:uncharacterized protein
MDGTALPDLAVFLTATFLASALAGLAGFAFGFVAAAVWLHLLTPLQTTTLIVVFGLLVQGLPVWRVHHALSFTRLWPFLAGGAIGVPVGVEVLRGTDPSLIRHGVGVVLLLFGLYAMARPKLAVAAGGRTADGAVGFFTGVLGGTTGLAGTWIGLRLYDRVDEAGFRRAVLALLLVSGPVLLR